MLRMMIILKMMMMMSQRWKRGCQDYSFFCEILHDENRDSGEFSCGVGKKRWKKT